MNSKGFIDRSQDSGSSWLATNFIDNGRISTVSNIITASEDPTAVRIIFSSGSTGKLSVGSSQVADQIVSAFATYAGTVGSSNPTDPISASVNNLVESATATNQTASVNTAVGTVAATTGTSKWIVWIVIIGIGYLAIRWIWKRFKRRR